MIGDEDERGSLKRMGRRVRKRNLWQPASAGASPTGRRLLGRHCVGAFSRRRGVQLKARLGHDWTPLESGRGLPRCRLSAGGGRNRASNSKTLQYYGAFRNAHGFLQLPRTEPVAYANSWSAPILWRFPLWIPGESRRNGDANYLFTEQISCWRRPGTGRRCQPPP
jgi:hypothetical protein